MNHLNQRKSPSAPLVSKEIETEFNRSSSSSFFSQRSREVPEVTDLSISFGWGGCCGNRIHNLGSFVTNFLQIRGRGGSVGGGVAWLGRRTNKALINLLIF